MDAKQIQPKFGDPDPGQAIQKSRNFREQRMLTIAIERWHNLDMFFGQNVPS